MAGGSLVATKPALDHDGEVMIAVGPGTGLFVNNQDGNRRLTTAAVDSQAAVFEGWLYNRQALRRELGLSADEVNAGLVLYAYRRWGEAFIQRLEGAFALCLWDPQTGRLLAGRDALGLVPQFFAATKGGGWYFATSAETLRRLPAISADISRGALAAHLLDWNHDIHETVYANIRRIPPGHLLSARPGATTGTPKRYWSPLPEGPISWLGSEDLGRFPELMKQSIGRLTQLGRPGIYLSGGLDSGSVAMFADDHFREQGGPQPQAFSLVVADEEANEERIQRGLAAALAMPQTVVPLGLGGSLAELFFNSLELNRTWPHPLASTFRSAYLPLGEAAVAAGSDLILNGDGGDEWLAIHNDLAADHLAAGELGQLGRLVNLIASTNSYPRWRALRHVAWEHGLKVSLASALSRPAATLFPDAVHGRRQRLAQAMIPSWLAPDPELHAELVARARATAERTYPYNYARQVMADTLDHPLTVLYMEESFEESRRIGIPIMRPFYDRDVVEYLVHLPPALRSLNGTHKGLLRTELHRRFPHLGYGTQLKPYATNFFSRMLIEGLKTSWPDMWSAVMLADLGIVDPAILHRSIERILESGQIASPKSLWAVLCAELWVRARV